MQTMTVTKFKATCLAVIERVRKTGEPIVITKNGEPAALISAPPQDPEKKRTSFGMFKDQIKITGDIVSPLGVEDWEVFKDDPA